MESNKHNNITIAVINVVNKRKKVAMNKDLNGGFGTADIYSNSIYEKIIGFLKRRSIKLPIVSLAFLMGIFKEKRISAKYYEGTIPRSEPDIILIYGSIVDYKYENHICNVLKKKFKKSKIGFIGPFPSVKPKLFSSADFIIKGDFEKYFLDDFKDISQLKGGINVEGKVDMDKLPQPELEGFPIKDYGYAPAISKKPFFALQASKGCPYSCAYYCAYGAFQGAKISERSPKNVVEDIIYLQNKYGMKGFQFRDPTFGIRPGYIEELCSELKRKNVDVQWGMETRIDLLDDKKIKRMFDVGLRNINIGIETADPGVAHKNKRLLANIQKQESLIKYCEQLGVKISAFYMFGYEGETRKKMNDTLNYAKKINTFLARFAVSTPYPGTAFFEEMRKRRRLITNDFERYTQFNLVIKHKTFNNKDIQYMRSKAYKEYYFRPKYMFKFLQWKIREFWL
jgi:anaerobic magnesium-protoporphyrin IX monomethyl ester cyclase